MSSSQPSAAIISDESGLNRVPRLRVSLATPSLRVVRTNGSAGVWVSVAIADLALSLSLEGAAIDSDRLLRGAAPAGTVPGTTRNKTCSGTTVEFSAYGVNSQWQKLEIDPTPLWKSAGAPHRGESAAGTAEEDGEAGGVGQDNDDGDLQGEGEAALDLDDGEDRQDDEEERHQETGKGGEFQPERGRLPNRAGAGDGNREHHEVGQRVENARGIPQQLKCLLLADADQSCEAED